MSVKNFTSQRKLAQRVKSAKGRKVSSTEWLRRQLNDEYVVQAKKQGYRSRAAFKLLEIDEKFSLLSNCYGVVLDIGAAPGSWLQILEQKCKHAKKIIGVDLRDVEPVGRATFIKGDFTSREVIAELLNEVQQKDGAGADCAMPRDASGIKLILSDMAPDSCGIAEVDHLRIVSLVEQVLDFAEQYLEKGGNLVCKMFNGSQYNAVWKSLGGIFERTKIFKPKASRAGSAEIYFIGIKRKV